MFGFSCEKTNFLKRKYENRSLFQIDTKRELLVN